MLSYVFALRSLCLYVRCTVLVPLLSQEICKLCSAHGALVCLLRQYAECMGSPSVSQTSQLAAGPPGVIDIIAHVLNTPASNTGQQQKVPMPMLSKQGQVSPIQHLCTEREPHALSGVPSAMGQKWMMRMEGVGRSRGWASSPWYECQPSSMPGCTPSAPGGHPRSDPCLCFCSVYPCLCLCTIYFSADCALSISRSLCGDVSSSCLYVATQTDL